MLPNFLCPGAQKSGTTTLYEILKQHPDIFLPQKIKETKFFVYEEKYLRGVQWYEKEFFSEWKNQEAVGEVDPAMMFEEKSAQRIFDTLGTGVKMIFIFRNPVARAYSHFLMSKRKGFEELSFDEAVEKENERMKNEPEKKFNFSYFSRGFYSEQVDRFKKLFPEGNFLFLVFEDDFIKNRKDTFDKLQDFLGVKRIELDLDIRTNEATTIKSKTLHDLTRRQNSFRNTLGKLLPKTVRRSFQKFLSGKNTGVIQNPRLDPNRERELIHQYFIDDIHRLEKMIHRDLSSWYSS
ncbi:MAG: sulfotransferase domain-containing protein [Chitinophagales bacterium]